MTFSMFKPSANRWRQSRGRPSQCQLTVDLDLSSKSTFRRTLSDRFFVVVCASFRWAAVDEQLHAVDVQNNRALDAESSVYFSIRCDEIIAGEWRLRSPSKSFGR